MAALTGCLAKLRRAEHHLDELKVSIVAVLQPNPERIRGHFEPDTSRWLYVARRSPTTRATWSPLIGDILSNYRSVLDYIVAELVVMGGGTITTRTGFPIVNDPTKWADASREKIAGVVQGSDLVIRSEQPCQAGNIAHLHPLALLRDLNNWDKHQAIHTTVQVASGQFQPWGPSFSQRGIASLGEPVMVAGPFQRDKPLATIEVTPEPGGNPELHKPLEATYDIAFEGGPPPAQGRSVIETLEAIAACVTEAVPRFEQFF